jgi:hypothetical protein
LVVPNFFPLFAIVISVESDNIQFIARLSIFKISIQY